MTSAPVYVTYNIYIRNSATPQTPLSTGDGPIYPLVLRVKAHGITGNDGLKDIDSRDHRLSSSTFSLIKARWSSYSSISELSPLNPGSRDLTLSDRPNTYRLGSSYINIYIDE